MKYSCRNCGHEHTCEGGVAPKQCALCGWTYFYPMGGLKDGHFASRKESVFPFTVLTVAIFSLIGFLWWLVH